MNPVSAPKARCIPAWGASPRVRPIEIGRAPTARFISNSFSFIPDEQAKNAGGRERSIILCHAAARDKHGYKHLMNYSDGKTKDAALFVAEEFTEDIEKVTKLLFDQANSDTALTKNIETWVSKHPPITGDF